MPEANTLYEAMYIINPGLTAIFSPWYLAPIGVFEVTMGVWLLFKGLTDSAGNADR